MSVVAVVEPSDLLGKELREGLEQRPHLWSELRLLTGREEAVGTLTEVRGGATMVKKLECDDLKDVDIVFVCGELAPSRRILARRPAATTALVMAPDAGGDDGRPVVAGINSEDCQRGESLLVPHPASIMLAHLLHPLLELELEECTATVIQPASMHGEAGLDELLGQARSILSFSEQPREVFGQQVAFNTALASQPVERLPAELAAVLGTQLPISLQILQGGIFHSLSVSLYFRCRRDPGTDAVRGIIAENPVIQLAEKPESLTPVDAAGHGEVLVGTLRRASNRPGGFWLWSVMDNLTRGGALNALEIAEAILG